MGIPAFRRRTPETAVRSLLELGTIAGCDAQSGNCGAMPGLDGHGGTPLRGLRIGRPGTISRSWKILGTARDSFDLSQEVHWLGQNRIRAGQIPCGRLRSDAARREPAADFRFGMSHPMHGASPARWGGDFLKTRGRVTAAPRARPTQNLVPHHFFAFSRAWRARLQKYCITGIMLSLRVRAPHAQSGPARATVPVGEPGSGHMKLLHNDAARECETAIAACNDAPGRPLPVPNRSTGIVQLC